MNREILFRGKSINNGELVVGNSVLFFKDTTKIYGELTYWREIEVIPETVGQFTGLCDKNGNKIFEGDILEFDGAENPEEERAVVIYADGRFGLKNPKYDYMDDLDSLTASMEIIVGNTYDGIYRRNEQ